MASWEDYAFTPIRSESTPALVARKLRDIISRGYFRPGQQLPEVALAQQFGVSRSVLREAMQRLTQEGLLESRPNRGVFVAVFGPAEVSDIYAARLAVERAACLRVIGSGASAETVAANLDALTDALESRASGGAGEEEVAWSDIEFHEHLVAAAASPRLNRMHATLATESRMCVAAFENQVYPVAERITAHRAIAGAIRMNDADELHRVLAEHMDVAVQAIVSRFEV
ncbi:GntR family transcriptional regulator [Leucobacter zeae]|nr:GntR family transcriptional regulator [Leucobacter zeae]